MIPEKYYDILHPSGRIKKGADLSTLEVPQDYPDAKTFLYCTINSIKPRECPICGIFIPVSNIIRGWIKTTCSRKCAREYDRPKALKTSIERYGENPYQTFADMANKSMIEKYGVHFSKTDEYRNRILETRNKKWGGKHHLSDPNGESRRKQIQTNLERYGVGNISSLPEVKMKRKQTCIERFGSDNPSRCDDIIEKIKATTLEKYGSQCYFQSTRFIETMEGFSESEPQRALRKFVECHEIPTISNDRSVISPLEIDILLPNHRIGIEVNGVYWHSSGDKETDAHWRNKHLFKTTAMSRVGCRLIHLTDVEINTKPEICLSMIASVIGKTDKIAARKCNIISVDQSVARQWFDVTHIQGWAPCSIYYGLVYDGELVSVMGFTKSRFDRNYDWELVRFSSRLNTTVVGGFSKLLSHFRENYVGSIVSYADYSRSNGDVYRKNGFKEISLLKPSYRWVKGDRIFNRHSFMRRNLPNILENFDPNLTEAENCWNHGYRRLWDCGQLKFILE